MKQKIKNNKYLYKFLISLREKLRVIYNTKTRSRFLWILRNGDKNISLNYPLNSNSVVFDIGAYMGNFSKEIYKKFKCNLYAFEPQTEYYSFLSKEFASHKENVKIFNFGLLDENKTIMISDIEGSSSIYSRPEGDLSVTVQMRSFIDFIEENSIKKIDLIYMNIEGSEYKLLNEIIQTGYIKNIDYLQIQFHNFVDGSKPLRKQIRKQLKKTHKCIFNFPFIWEGWQIND